MNPLRGILLKVLSVVVFMGMVTCIKVTTIHIPAGEVVFFRSFFALPVILIWLWYAHHLHDGLLTKNPMGHLWRGLVGCSAMAFSFTALGLLPLPEVTAIGYAAPLLVTILAAMFLGETIRVYRLAAIFIGMAGVLIVLAPRFSDVTLESATKLETIGAMAALLSAVSAALAQVFVRKLVQVERTAAIEFSRCRHDPSERDRQQRQDRAGHREPEHDCCSAFDLHQLAHEDLRQSSKHR